VVAADVYSVPPHTGRGGWSWYTGSAGWMYRLILESLLGLRLRIDDQGARLDIAPCVPAHWTSYAVDYRFRSSGYRIEIQLTGEAGAPLRIDLDGRPQHGPAVALVDDGQDHVVCVRAPAPASSPAGAGRAGAAR
jgi:cyclic beta-1,2-glucan synthetase